MSHQLWSTCLKYKISPNQIYYLDSCREKIKVGSVINADAERIVAHNNGLVDEDNNLTEKAVAILNEFETYLVKTKKKVTTDVLGKDFMQKVNEFREIFPDMRLPSKELARQTTTTLAERFVWFRKTYPEYDWDLILDATDYYVNYYSKTGFLYMATSSYFIKKTDPRTKETISKLADTCQAILDNPDILNS